MKERRLRRADLILIVILLAAGVILSIGAVILSRTGESVLCLRIWRSRSPAQTAASTSL